MYTSLVCSKTATTESMLAQHDIQALNIYNQVKHQYSQKTDPLLIAWPNKLVLYHHHKIQEFVIIPPAYDDLKSIAHVSLAVFALFDPINEFPKNMAEVTAYKKMLLHTESAIQSLPLKFDQKTRQTLILTLTQNLLKEAIEKKVVSQQLLQQFFNTISPLVKKNIDEATKLAIDTLNQNMTKIQQQLTLEEQNQMFVIIPTSKMPRQGNLMGQYFSKYLNAPMDSSRLIFAEGLTETKDVLALVGTWKVETKLSALFFHHPDTMKTDILAPSTEIYLQHCQRDNTHHTALACEAK
ncbi:MAG: hypothetical protein CK424_04310 [Legionella sp.]|nr:MAG: hypothetical protein CK424_04310 [Legionella sp.]